MYAPNAALGSTSIILHGHVVNPLISGSIGLQNFRMHGEDGSLGCTGCVWSHMALSRAHVKAFGWTLEHGVLRTAVKASRSIVAWAIIGVSRANQRKRKLLFGPLVLTVSPPHGPAERL